jgi:amino acid transporter
LYESLFGYSSSCGNDFKIVGHARFSLPRLPAVVGKAPDIGAIAGEVRDPQRNLPKIYLLGTTGLLALYVLVNLAYLHILSLDEMRASTTVASDVMQRIVGPTGATIVVLFVLISTLGSTHASIMTGARVTFAQAQDGLLFRTLGKIDAKHQTPGIALFVQLLLSCTCALFFQQFNSLAGGFVFTMWIFYGLGGIAMMRLHATTPKDLPYRCWGYPFVPLTFIASAAAMTVLQIVDSFTAPTTPGTLAPWLQTCIFLGILLLGIPAYDLWRALTRPPAPSAT